jgi:hypothetical protein
VERILHQIYRCTIRAQLFTRVVTAVLNILLNDRRASAAIVGHGIGRAGFEAASDS